MAITERYVRADAAGGGNGTTDSNSGANGAYTWAEMITAINGGSHAGFRYNVKVGSYSVGSTVITGSGTTTSPLIIQGFSSAIGDSIQLRDANGILITTNMPQITFSAGNAMDCNGSNNIILAGLNLIQNINGNGARVGQEGVIYNCRIENNSTGASCIAARLSGNRSKIINCDAIAGSSTSAIGIFGNVLVAGCRVTSGGIGINTTTGSTIINNTVIGGVTGISYAVSVARIVFISNTIANCSGDGLSAASSSVDQVYCGNHITGCGGWGINLNTVTGTVYLYNNRFRSNTSGNVSGGGDWGLATGIADVTASASDSDDFANPGAGNFALNPTAAGYAKNFGHLLNIGASGTLSSGGGGGGWGFRRRPRVTGA